MRTKAAVVRRVGAPYEVVDLDLDPPKDGEVLLRFEAAGLCRSGLRIADGDLQARLPMVAGHEGAGVVEMVGVRRPLSRRQRGLRRNLHARYVLPARDGASAVGGPHRPLDPAVDGGAS